MFQLGSTRRSPTGTSACPKLVILRSPKHGRNRLKTWHHFLYQREAVGKVIAEQKELPPDARLVVVRDNERGCSDVGDEVLLFPLQNCRDLLCDLFEERLEREAV